MSTEKLSELSKPVFEIEVSGGHWLNCTSGKLTPDAGADFSDWPDGVNRLYSQEYVSALKRESAVNWEAAASLNVENQELKKRIAELEAIRADASQVFKEIGNELGCNPDNESIMVAIDYLKATQMTGPLKDVLKRNIELEAKLATPVQLPDTRQSVSGDRYQWSDGVFNYKQDAIAMLRTAGFTVEGGDA